MKALYGQYLYRARSGRVATMTSAELDTAKADAGAMEEAQSLVDEEGWSTPIHVFRLHDVGTLGAQADGWARKPPDWEGLCVALADTATEVTGAIPMKTAKDARIRLVTAAPDLLDALLDLLCQVDEILRAAPPDRVDLIKAVKKARTAVAKAQHGGQ